MQITNAVGACERDAIADRFHDFEIDAEKIVAAHARLARHAGGDDHDIGAGNRAVIIRTGEMREKPCSAAA